MSLPISRSTTCGTADVTLITSRLRPLFVVAILRTSRLHWIHRIHGRTAPWLYRSASYTIPVVGATSSLSRIGAAIILKVFYNAIRIIHISVRDYFDLVHLVLVGRDVKRVLKFLFAKRPKLVLFHLFWRGALGFPILFVTWSATGLRATRLFCLDCPITTKYLLRIQVRILVWKCLSLAFGVPLGSMWNRWCIEMINEARLMLSTRFLCVKKRSRGLLRRILAVRWRSAVGISYCHRARPFLLSSYRGTFTDFLGLILDRLV